MPVMPVHVATLPSGLMKTALRLAEESNQTAVDNSRDLLDDLPYFPFSMR